MNLVPANVRVAAVAFLRKERRLVPLLVIDPALFSDLNLFLFIFLKLFRFSNLRTFYNLKLRDTFLNYNLFIQDRIYSSFSGIWFHCLRSGSLFLGSSPSYISDKSHFILIFCFLPVNYYGLFGELGINQVATFNCWGTEKER